MNIDADVLDGMLTNLQGKLEGVKAANEQLRVAEHEMVKYLADRRHYSLLKINFSEVRRAIHYANRGMTRRR